MSIHAMNWSRTHTGLRPRDHLILREFSYRHQFGRRLFVGLATLAARCDMSDSTVKRVVKRLATLGLIRIKRVFYEGRTQNEYFLIFDVTIDGSAKGKPAPATPASLDTATDTPAKIPSEPERRTAWQKWNLPK